MSDHPAVVFGDVHGNSQALRTIIQQVRARFGYNVNLYSVGDLIDRGPDSKGVLDICVKEGVLGILGNHELWLCSVLSGHPMNDGPYSSIMGGLATLKSYDLSRGDPDHVGPAIRRAIPMDQQKWLLSLPPYRRITVGEHIYWLTHTGLTTDMAAGILHELDGRPYTDEFLLDIVVRVAPDPFFWLSPKLRERQLHRFQIGATQVFGHTPVSAPVIEPGHFIALDTGCGTCPPYTLSAVILFPDGRDPEVIRSR